MLMKEYKGMEFILNKVKEPARKKWVTPRPRGPMVEHHMKHLRLHACDTIKHSQHEGGKVQDPINRLVNRGEW